MRSNKPQLIRRLKIVEGEVRGVQEMVEDGVYCVDIITQTSAVKQALSGVEDAIMENHLATHVMHQIKHGQERQAAAEIMKVYKLKGKK